MTYSRPVVDLIKERFSCRTFSAAPIDSAHRIRLSEAAAALHAGPLGIPLRFELVAATAADTAELRGLGTYGFIRGATGFLIGAAPTQGFGLESFGCAMEELVLLATDLGLGSCWLGGTFRRGSFSRRIARRRGESIPAVIAVGVISDLAAARGGALRTRVGGSRRKGWDQLFFDGGFGVPLTPDSAGALSGPLEMLRLGPSASNKQPWRVVRQGKSWHFFLQRTPGYRSALLARLLGILDIQRVDIGIAMCHFELAAREQGLKGEWMVRDPGLALPDPLTQYIVSWQG